jgi:hypothetical protein
LKINFHIWLFRNIHNGTVDPQLLFMMDEVWLHLITWTCRTAKTLKTPCYLPSSNTWPKFNVHSMSVCGMFQFYLQMCLQFCSKHTLTHEDEIQLSADKVISAQGIPTSTSFHV